MFNPMFETAQKYENNAIFKQNYTLKLFDAILKNHILVESVKWEI